MASYELAKRRYSEALVAFRDEAVRAVRASAEVICGHYDGEAIVVHYNEWDATVSALMVVGRRSPVSAYDDLDGGPLQLCDAVRVLEESLAIYAQTCYLSRAPKAEPVTHIDPSGQIR
jgi:hypothetical protein